MAEKLNTKDPVFVELCEYVRTEIFEYDETKKLSKHVVLRLMGFSQGKFMANNNIPAQAKYTWKEILLTFKIHKHLLKTSSAKIKEEKNKFNYIMAIVDSKINDVSQRLKEKDAIEKKMESLEIIQTEGAEYKKKSKDKRPSLQDIW